MTQLQSADVRPPAFASHEIFVGVQARLQAVWDEQPAKDEKNVRQTATEQRTLRGPGPWQSCHADSDCPWHSFPVLCRPIFLFYYKECFSSLALIAGAPLNRSSRRWCRGIIGVQSRGSQPIGNGLALIARSVLPHRERLAKWASGQNPTQIRHIDLCLLWLMFCRGREEADLSRFPHWCVPSHPGTPTPLVSLPQQLHVVISSARHQSH